VEAFSPESDVYPAMRKLLFLLTLISTFLFPVYGTAQAILPVHQSGSKTESKTGVEWSPLLRESGLFLGIQHSVRLLTEPGSRAQLAGPFLKDYFESVRGLHGWSDGDDFLTNYIGHPIQGSVTGFLFVAHDPRSRGLEFGKHGAYWRSRLKAMAYTAVYSAQFELGPISEASLGNLGGPSAPGTMGAVDLVMTPVGGFVWQVTEDALDRYLVRWLEDRTSNRMGKIMVRGMLNPARSFTNMLRFRVPWHRDTRPGVDELSQMN
jgi:hypothetical protein